MKNLIKVLICISICICIVTSFVFAQDYTINVGDKFNLSFGDIDFNITWELSNLGIVNMEIKQPNGSDFDISGIAPGTVTITGTPDVSNVALDPINITVKQIQNQNPTIDNPSSDGNNPNQGNENNIGSEIQDNNPQNNQADTNVILPTAGKYYGFDSLSSDNQKKAYVIIYNGIESYSSAINLNGLNLTTSEVDKVYNLIRNDHGELYWMGNGFGCSTIGSYVSVVNPDYSCDKSNLSKFNSAISSIMSGCPSDPFEATLYLHDALAKKVTYGNSTHMHDAYGALVEGKGVCEAYARAYQVLLAKAGIKSYIVIGDAGNESHAWNMVMINGSCYYTDVTWDDQGSYLFHTYLNLSKDEIGLDHFASVSLPGCGHKGMRYFDKKYGKGIGIISTKDFSADSFAAMFTDVSGSGSNCVRSVEVLYTGSGDFQSIFKSRYQEIAKALGFSNYKYTTNSLGNVTIISFTGTCDGKKGLTVKNSESFKIDVGVYNSEIDKIDLSALISGGIKPYTYEIVTGPDWIVVSKDGIISGTRPSSAQNEATLKILVSDNSNPKLTKEIVITIGAVKEKLDTEDLKTIKESNALKNPSYHLVVRDKKISENDLGQYYGDISLIISTYLDYKSGNIDSFIVIHCPASQK